MSESADMFIASEEAPLKLDIGSGNHPHGEAWTHVDVDPQALSLDVLTSAFNLPYPDQSVEEIFTSHFLEHITAQEVPVFLGECERVLRYGAWLTIHVPHVRNVLQAMEDAPLHRWADFMPAVFGLPDEAASWASMHKCLFVPRLLVGLLKQHGFSFVQEVTLDTEDPHDVAWSELLGGRRMSLKIMARK